MNRKFNLVLSAALCTMLGLAFWSTSAAAKTRLKMASAYPARLVQLGTLGKRLEKSVKAMSGGDLRLKFFEPRALVPALEVFDAVKSGAVDAGWSSPGFWQSRERALALFSAVPFGPEAREYGAWLFYGGGEKLMQEIYAEHDIHGQICGVIAPEASGWFRREIKSLEEFKGLKVRFFGLGALVMQKLGADTQLLAPGDTYPALERGVIDGLEYSQPAIDLQQGFHQIAKHYYFPGWHQQATALELLVNKKKWDALSPQHKAIINEACRANYALGMAEGEAIQSKALDELRAKGVKFHVWSDAILSRLHAEWLKLAEEISAEDAKFAKAWTSLKEFRASYSQWDKLGYLKKKSD